VSLSPKSGPATTELRVSGSGFEPYGKIDIYFGTQDEALAIADGSGSFSRIAIPAPASALPGTHWVSAVERSGHTGAQATFDVIARWSEFHFRHNGMRLNPYENVLDVHNVAKLAQKWSYKEAYGVFSSPAVVNGVVYFGSTYDHHVYALHAHTGRPLWSYATGSNIGSSPAVASGVVYIGSTDNSVYALNARTGAKLWSYATGNQVVSSPAVANGVVLIGSTDNSL
jgi:outer membrane protein assembly factor BamB